MQIDKRIRFYDLDEEQGVVQVLDQQLNKVQETFAWPTKWVETGFQALKEAQKYCNNHTFKVCRCEECSDNYYETLREEFMSMQELLDELDYPLDMEMGYIP